MEELFYVASCSEKLSDAVEAPVVCDHAPYEVPAGRVHLFDVPLSVIRRSIADAVLSDSDVISLRAHLQKARGAPPDDLFAALTSLRPIMDRMIPVSLRHTDGSGIYNPFVPQWIVFNFRMASGYAVEGRDQRAARKSIAKICTALLPSPLIRERPNEAGVARDYPFIRERADPILRKKYNNRSLKSADLHKQLPQFLRSQINHVLDKTPRNFALELLAARHKLKPSYIWNLVKRGNLYFDVTAHWREALLSSPQTPACKYPPAKPGALSCEPLKAAIRGR